MEFEKQLVRGQHLIIGTVHVRKLDFIAVIYRLTKRFRIIQIFSLYN